MNEEYIVCNVQVIRSRRRSAARWAGGHCWRAWRWRPCWARRSPGTSQSSPSARGSRSLSSSRWGNIRNIYSIYSNIYNTIYKIICKYPGRDLVQHGQPQPHHLPLPAHLHRAGRGLDIHQVGDCHNITHYDYVDANIYTLFLLYCKKSLMHMRYYNISI